RNTQLLHRRAVKHVVVRADALDGANGAGAESRARAVGHAEVHRHADDRDVEVAEIRVLRVNLAERRIKESRDAGKWCNTRIAREDAVGNTPEARVIDVATAAFAIPLAKFGELFVVPAHDQTPFSVPALSAMRRSLCRHF